jgi:hypothetical protein
MSRTEPSSASKSSSSVRPCAQPVLQPRHQLGDLRAGNPEPPGGLGEAAGLSHGGEGGDLVETVHGIIS